MRREAGARAERGRARGLSLHVVRALRLQALRRLLVAAHRGSAAACSARARTPARSPWATGWRARSRSSRDNHPARSSRSRGRRRCGGILRDVFAIGARPIAILDSLRFGEPAARLAPATCSSTRRRASGTTATRSAWRPSAGDLLRGAVRAELPHQRDAASA